VVRPDNVYTPVEVGRLALEEIRACMDPKTRTINLGFHLSTIKPLRPGKLCTIQAYTSNYKTGFMTAWARRLAANIVEREAEHEMVIYVSWEDTVEDMGIYDLAHATAIPVESVLDGKLSAEQMKRLETAAFKRGAIPLWLIGDTSGKGMARKRMTMTHIEKCLGWVSERMEFKPAAIYIDYVNLICPESKASWGAKGRRTDIMELTYRVRELGLMSGCPAIEQFSDLLLSLWMVSTSETMSDPPAQLIGPDGKPMEGIFVTPNLLLMGIGKQKRGPAGSIIPLYVDPTRNIVRPMSRDTEMPF